MYSLSPQKRQMQNGLNAMAGNLNAPVPDHAYHGFSQNAEAALKQFEDIKGPKNSMTYDQQTKQHYNLRDAENFAKAVDAHQHFVQQQRQEEEYTRQRLAWNQKVQNRQIQQSQQKELELLDKQLKDEQQMINMYAKDVDRQEQRLEKEREKAQIRRNQYGYYQQKIDQKNKEFDEKLEKIRVEKLAFEVQKHQQEAAAGSPYQVMPRQQFVIQQAPVIGMKTRQVSQSMATPSIQVQPQDSQSIHRHGLEIAPPVRFGRNQNPYQTPIKQSENPYASPIKQNNNESLLPSIQAKAGTAPRNRSTQPASSTPGQKSFSQILLEQYNTGQNSTATPSKWSQPFVTPETKTNPNQNPFTVQRARDKWRRFVAVNYGETDQNAAGAKAQGVRRFGTYNRIYGGTLDALREGDDEDDEDDINDREGQASKRITQTPAVKHSKAQEIRAPGSTQKVAKKLRFADTIESEVGDSSFQISIHDAKQIARPQPKLIESFRVFADDPSDPYGLKNKGEKVESNTHQQEAAGIGLHLSKSAKLFSLFTSNGANGGQQSEVGQLNEKKKPPADPYLDWLEIRKTKEEKKEVKLATRFQASLTQQTMQLQEQNAKLKDQEWSLKKTLRLSRMLQNQES